MTITASLTTFTNASDNEAKASKIATDIASSGSDKERLNSTVNCNNPIIINQLFLLVPNKGTLSEIKPYKILNDQGM